MFQSRSGSADVPGSRKSGDSPFRPFALPPENGRFEVVNSGTSMTDPGPHPVVIVLAQAGWLNRAWRPSAKTPQRATGRPERQARTTRVRSASRQEQGE